VRRANIKPDVSGNSELDPLAPLSIHLFTSEVRLETALESIEVVARLVSGYQHIKTSVHPCGCLSLATHRAVAVHLQPLSVVTLLLYPL